MTTKKSSQDTFFVNGEQLIAKVKALIKEGNDRLVAALISECTIKVERK